MQTEAQVIRAGNEVGKLPGPCLLGGPGGWEWGDSSRPSPILLGLSTLQPRVESHGQIDSRKTLSVSFAKLGSIVGLSDAVDKHVQFWAWGVT